MIYGNKTIYNVRLKFKNARKCKFQEDQIVEDYNVCDVIFV